MYDDSIILLKAVKYSAAALTVLTAAGIATLMYISWDKDEDITGIVAPALLLMSVSGITAVVMAIMQMRANRFPG